MDIPIQMPQILGADFKPAEISTLGEPCEPFGELSFFKMMDVFFNKAYAFEEDGANAFLLKDITELFELRAAVLACRRLEVPVIPILNIDSDTEENVFGKELGYLITLQSLNISAIGFEVNPDSDLDDVYYIVKDILKFSEVPLYIKLTDKMDSGNLPLKIKRFLDLCQVTFDCSGLSDEKVQIVKEAIEKYAPVDREKEDTSMVAANHVQAFFLNPEQITLSPAIDIGYDMAEELLDFDDELYNVITVEINTHDDGFYLSQNLHWLELPVMFKADTEEALRMALCYYHGRALVDSTSLIDSENIKSLAKEFGAIMY